MNLGECIRNARKKAGYTQKTLAQKSGLAEITIRQYETNKREPRLEQIEKIAAALELKSDDLYRSTIIGTVNNSTFQGTTEEFLMIKEVSSIEGLFNFLSFHGVCFDKEKGEFIFDDSEERYDVKNIGLLSSIGAEQIKVLIKELHKENM